MTFAGKRLWLSAAAARPLRTATTTNLTVPSTVQLVGSKLDGWKTEKMRISATSTPATQFVVRRALQSVRRTCLNALSKKDNF